MAGSAQRGDGGGEPAMRLRGVAGEATRRGCTGGRRRLKKGAAGSPERGERGSGGLRGGGSSGLANFSRRRGGRRGEPGSIPAPWKLEEAGEHARRCAGSGRTHSRVGEALGAQGGRRTADGEGSSAGQRSARLGEAVGALELEDNGAVGLRRRGEVEEASEFAGELREATARRRGQVSSGGFFSEGNGAAELGLGRGEREGEIWGGGEAEVESRVVMGLPRRSWPAGLGRRVAPRVGRVARTP